MGSVSSTKARKEAIISDVYEQTIQGQKAIEDFVSVKIVINTGYFFKKIDGGVKIIKETDPSEVNKRLHGLVLEIVKNKKENKKIAISILSILPVRCEDIIDKDESLFDYIDDDIYYDNYVSIESIMVSSGIKFFKIAFEQLTRESQRVLLLYGADSEVNVEEDTENSG